jgi:carbonic anhydrase/acetyltransferase-like protein (isoleucine patch superfamily)
LREVAPDEVEAVAHAIRTGGRATLGTSDDLPPLDASPFVPEGPFEGVLHAIHGKGPRLGRAYVAPTAVVVGDVELHDDTGTYFGCVLAAGGARIVIGEASNVQDNALIVTDERRGDVIVGRRVTIGHNVRMGAGTFGDDALVGMSSVVGDGVVVEPGGCIAAGAHVAAGTVVKSGWIWAGRPARAFRALKPAEREWFATGVNVYVGYARAYRGEG